jgi:protein FAM32A
MPSDDYTVIGGGLKLKGSKPTGVTKKKKKDKIPKDGASTLISKDSKDTEGESKSAIHKALEDEDTDMKYRMEEDKAKMRELDPRDNDGKTASERQFEEMRRKRVCHIFSSLTSIFPF